MLRGGAGDPTVGCERAAFTGNLIARRPGEDARRQGAVVRVKSGNQALRAGVTVAKMGIEMSGRLDLILRAPETVGEWCWNGVRLTLISRAREPSRERIMSRD